MNDTIKISDRQHEILRMCIFSQDALSTSEIADTITHKSSLVTIKRDVSELYDRGYLERHGVGPGTKYSISVLGRIHTNIDIDKYSEQDIDIRGGNSHYNFTFFDQYPPTIFSNDEITKLNTHHHAYQNNIKNISSTIHQKELARFVIELSWKSSRIEGNTYTLLDTERLINEGIKSEKNTDDEAIMILNHKKAFDYILEHKNDFAQTLSVKDIKKVHRILVKDLGISSDFRKGRVGITGSHYIPLELSTQIQEAIEAIDALCRTIHTCETAFDKAILALTGLSYIQAFEDGNKRIARFTANAILMAYGYAPLSYRSVKEEHYRESMLVFYETQSMVAIKDIFIDQYIFSVENYSV